MIKEGYLIVLAILGLLFLVGTGIYVAYLLLPIAGALWTTLFAVTYILIAGVGVWLGAKR